MEAFVDVSYIAWSTDKKHWPKVSSVTSVITFLIKCQVAELIVKQGKISWVWTFFHCNSRGGRKAPWVALLCSVQGNSGLQSTVNCPSHDNHLKGSSEWNLYKTNWNFCRQQSWSPVAGWEHQARSSMVSPWCRREKSLAWLRLTSIINVSSWLELWELQRASQQLQKTRGAEPSSSLWAFQPPKASPCCETGGAAKANPDLFEGIAWSRRDCATNQSNGSATLVDSLVAASPTWMYHKDLV